MVITSLREPSDARVGDGASAEARGAARVDPIPVVTPPITPRQAEAAVPLVSIEPSSEPLPSTEPAPGPVAMGPAPIEPSITQTPAAEPFQIPLPMMPGTRVMKRSQRPDAEQGGVIHTLALSVPAPGMQVEAFYRSALGDAKLVVTGGGGEPSSMGSGHRSALRGRGREARVNVNMQQRAGTLRTVVRIIWRTLP